MVLDVVTRLTSVIKVKHAHIWSGNIGSIRRHRALTDWLTSSILLFSLCAFVCFRPILCWKDLILISRNRFWQRSKLGAGFEGEIQGVKYEAHHSVAILSDRDMNIITVLCFWSPPAIPPLLVKWDCLLAVWCMEDLVESNNCLDLAEKIRPKFNTLLKQNKNSLKRTNLIVSDSGFWLLRFRGLWGT